MIKKDENLLIGQRLRLFRDEILGLSVKALSLATGIADAHIVDVERGKVAIKSDLVKALVRHFDLREEWLAVGFGVPQTTIGELELKKKLINLADATNAVAMNSELSHAEKIKIRDIMYAIKVSDFELLRNVLNLSEREHALLDDFRALGDKEKDAAETMLHAAAQPKVKKA